MLSELGRGDDLPARAARGRGPLPRREEPLELRVLEGIEAHDQLRAGFEHRALDRARVALQERERAFLGQDGLLRVGDLAPRRAAGVGELLPAGALRPLFQLPGRHAVLLVVVELVGELPRLEEVEGLLHGVAVADAVGHYLARSFMARSRPFSVVGNMRPFMSSLTMPIDWR